MAVELDIFVGNTTIMDEEVYQLWLDGYTGRGVNLVPEGPGSDNNFTTVFNIEDKISIPSAYMITSLKVQQCKQMGDRYSSNCE